MRTIGDAEDVRQRTVPCLAQFEKVITAGPGKGKFPENSIRNRKTNIEILGRDYFAEFIEQYYGPLDYDCKKADG